ncbi:glycosyltransferase [Stygiolobus azoricus]|uniref:Glycosyltransferase n=1 Tax=Stygiolobus azoricus TaxID=41675 RepID=A0A650CPH5_9CREN|nr:glycosyltransferase family A protein [Stygiolobus azoricus]QGR19746.1 glycosyltransferase [Stygiolobus azoricus]
MTSICVYGTVFNNVNTVEESIKSVWSPDYDIVIVDNYSTDGTWEKLQELKKEYNLTLLRLKSTRGGGRQYALYNCPEGSITAYFDLDNYYNENFHKLLDFTKSTNKVIHGNWFMGGNREHILRKGGWRTDLNFGEDVEFVARIGFDYYVPVIIHYDLYPKYCRNKQREARYAKNIRLYWRRFRNYIDDLTGKAYNFKETIIRWSVYHRTFTIPIGMLGFLLSKTKKSKRFCNKYANPVYIEILALEKMIDNKELGIQDKYFAHLIPEELYSLYPFLRKIVVNKLKEKIGYFEAFQCPLLTVFVKNEDGLNEALNVFNIDRNKCFKVLMDS